MESMRGNNPGFSHATAFHEMIPGHNLVGYPRPALSGLSSESRQRRPFFGEGWPLYWELTDVRAAASTRRRSRASARSSGTCTAARASSSRSTSTWASGRRRSAWTSSWTKSATSATNADGRSAPFVRVAAVRQPAAVSGGVSARRAATARHPQGTGRRPRHDATSSSTTRSCARATCRSRSSVSRVTKMKLTPDMDINYKFAGKLPAINNHR